jgi:hypothetical protein
MQHNLKKWGDALRCREGGREAALSVLLVGITQSSTQSCVGRRNWVVER